MKNEKLSQWLFSPFRFLAGTKGLILGIATLFLVSFLGYWSNTYFDGVLDIHYRIPNSDISYGTHLAYELLSWLILTIVFFVIGKIVSKSSFRLIDLAGTLAMSQAPLLLAAVWGFISSIHLNMNSKMNIEQLLSQIQQHIVVFVLTAIVSLMVIAWSIILKYNAYSVSTNVKGNVGYFSFAIGLIISELLFLLVKPFIPF